MTPEKRESGVNLDKLISLREAAKFCPYSQDYLSLRARQGKPEAKKVGRTWKTTRRWLEEYVKEVSSYKQALKNDFSDNDLDRTARKEKLFFSFLKKAEEEIARETNNFFKKKESFFQKVSVSLGHLNNKYQRFLEKTEKASESLQGGIIAFFAKNKNLYQQKPKLVLATASVFVFAFLCLYNPGGVLAGWQKVSGELKDGWVSGPANVKWASQLLFEKTVKEVLTAQAGLKNIAQESKKTIARSWGQKISGDSANRIGLSDLFIFKKEIEINELGNAAQDKNQKLLALHIKTRPERKSAIKTVFDYRALFFAAQKEFLALKNFEPAEASGKLTAAMVDLPDTIFKKTLNALEKSVDWLFEINTKNEELKTKFVLANKKAWREFKMAYYNGPRNLFEITAPFIENTRLAWEDYWAKETRLAEKQEETKETETKKVAEETEKTKKEETVTPVTEEKTRETTSAQKTSWWQEAINGFKSATVKTANLIKQEFFAKPGAQIYAWAQNIKNIFAPRTVVLVDEEGRAVLVESLEKLKLKIEEVYELAADQEIVQKFVTQQVTEKLVDYKTEITKIVREPIAGPPGPAGPQGPAGPSGEVTNITNVNYSSGGNTYYYEGSQVFSGDISGKSIAVSGDGGIGRDFGVSGNTTLGEDGSNTLTVKAQSTFQESATFNGAVAINDTLTATGNTSLGANLDVDGNLTVDGSTRLGDNAGADELTINSASTTWLASGVLTETASRAIYIQGPGASSTSGTFLYLENESASVTPLIVQGSGGGNILYLTDSGVLTLANTTDGAGGLRIYDTAGQFWSLGEAAGTLSYSNPLTILAADDFASRASGSYDLTFADESSGLFHLYQNDESRLTITASGGLTFTASASQPFTIVQGSTDKFTLNENGDFIFSPNVSISADFEVAGNAIVSGTFSANAVASHTFGGDLAVGDDLTVGGALSVSGVSSDGQLIIDADNAEAFLVRKDGDAGDVLTVNTLSGAVSFGQIASHSFAGDLTIGDDLTVTGDITAGISNTNYLIVNSTLNSHLIPASNNTYDLGSASYYYRNVYTGTLVANNISAGGTNISGTTAETLALNTDNATEDTEDSYFIFTRGTVTPNATIKWNSTDDRVEFNQDVKIEDETPGTGVTSFLVKAGAGQSDNFLTQWYTNYDSLLAGITASGSLSIYDSTPEARMSVVATGSYDLLNLTSYGGSDGDLLTVNSSGYVGINDTSPDARFEVVASTATDDYAFMVSAGDSGTDGDLFLVTSQGYTAIGTATHDNTQLTVRQDSTGNIVDFKDGDTSIFTIADGGNITVAGAISYSGSGKPKRSIILTASGATTPTSSGAAQTKVDGTNHTYYVLDFDDSTDESAFWHWTMPDAYDAGTVDVTFYWEAAEVTGDVIWAAQAAGVAPDSAEDIDPSLGVAQTVTDTAQANANDLASAVISSWNPSWAAGDYITLKVYRDADAVGDTMSGDARLVKVKIEYSVDAESD